MVPWLVNAVLVTLLPIGRRSALPWPSSGAPAASPAPGEEKAEHRARLDAAKSEFLANMSHEFCTPLTIARGLAAPTHRDVGFA